MFSRSLVAEKDAESPEEPAAAEEEEEEEEEEEGEPSQELDDAEWWDDEREDVEDDLEPSTKETAEARSAWGSWKEVVEKG